MLSSFNFSITHLRKQEICILYSKVCIIIRQCIVPVLWFSIRMVHYWSSLLLLLSRLSCPTLCEPIDDSPPGFPVPGILLARTLEWVAISFSNAWKWKVKVKSLRRVRLLVTPWTAAYQAPLSMGFSRQEYWSAVPLPSPTGHHTRRYILGI